MDDGAESLMTVHLLTHLGHSFPLQQTLDRLLEWLCLDIRLFLVSERIPPRKYYERHRRRSCSFPGISVVLFLREDLGEERVFQVHELFQRPPWRFQCAQFAHGHSPPCAPCHQDFYGLDEQLPVWGIRRVHRGPEILRVTLHCSFENYEDAVRLYELILQREATLQRSTSSVFVLHATRDAAVQLCLQQLPCGVAAQPRDAAALQFKVQEMGQLVPLLPNPCVPISSTRWQTQDYEGNTILLKVQSSSRTLERNIGLSQQHTNTGGGRIPQDCTPAPVPVKQGIAGRRSQEIRALEGKAESGAAAACERGSSDLQRLRRSPGLQAPVPDTRGHRAARTDPDIGLALGTPGSARCPLSHFPRALRSSLLPPAAPGAGPAQAGSALPGPALPGSVLPGSAPPGSALPGSALPGSAQPGSALPGSAQPGSALPGSARPGSARPGSAQPGSALPGSALPGPARPSSAQPGPAQPGSVQPGSAQPARLRGRSSAAAPGAPQTPRAGPAHPAEAEEQEFFI
ncbi:protein FAM124B [Prinia subflava]|uniref:protein FAM124B n=1 Tax=Prinia subflava TaxID=208062 RepID=UPI002FE2B9B5